MLDAASPQLRGMLSGGAKLLKFDPATRQLMRRIDFDETIVYPTSYLHDVRVDTQASVAYLIDSENNAVTRITAAGQFQLVAQDAQLKWPDSFSIAADGPVYVTTSQLHIPRSQRTEPYRIFKLMVPQ